MHGKGFTLRTVPLQLLVFITKKGMVITLSVRLLDEVCLFGLY